MNIMLMKMGGIRRTLPMIAFLLVMVPGMAFAASAEWRPTYDLIMKWVNFIILAAVIFKYSREPMRNFLNQQKTDVVSEMNTLEAEKERLVSEINTARDQAVENQEKLKEMKARLIAQGENKKQQVIELARQQGAFMLEETRKKLENRILQAKDQLKMELADMAFDQVTKTLPRIITDTDNQRFLDIYMHGIR